MDCERCGGRRMVVEDVDPLSSDNERVCMSCGHRVYQPAFRMSASDKAWLDQQRSKSQNRYQLALIASDGVDDPLERARTFAKVYRDAIMDEA